MVTVKQRLRPLREKQALSQRDLAEKAGMAQATVNRLELGLQEARPSTLRKLAHALGVKPAALID